MNRRVGGSNPLVNTICLQDSADVADLTFARAAEDVVQAALGQGPHREQHFVGAPPRELEPAEKV
ncbi:hypothetical protein CYG48_13150 [Neorhizobium sp. SOG26]|nr:hypothetical protein CYG48_13150 [Neorhizobium sp. SOG26]